MRVVIQHVFIGIFTVTFCQENTWEKSPVSIAWNSIFHRMTFREPIVFTPFEVKTGYLNYGGKKYWSGAPFNTSIMMVTDLPVLLDSTQYQFNILDELTNRQGMYIELDFLRTNLPHFIIYQNYLDLQIGLGIQLTNFTSNPSLPSETGKKWKTIPSSSNRGDYYFHPRSIGLNINSSLGWQLSRNRATYLYYSFGFTSLSLYESEGDDRNLTGTGLTESFGIGTKYIFNQIGNYNYTLGIEAKWSRLYMSNVVSPDGLSPIHGIDLRASGIFITYGIQFGGKHTDGDIAYSYMIKNDYISAAENFEYFLVNKGRHNKRKKAIKMLQFCQFQIPYQQVNYGIKAMYESDYNKAIEWFDAAESEAEEDLKIEIQSYRRKIASIFLDSIQNYKNIMTIAEAEKLTRDALELFPEHKQGDQILAGIYLDKGILNTNVGNYSEAIQNYLHAIELYPPIETIILEKFNQLINALMKDAYFSAKAEELHLVIKSLITIIELNPELANELDSYIIKLETKLKNLTINGDNKYAQNYIEKRQLETMQDFSNILQLGMTLKEVKKIQGMPQFIDKHTEKNQHFEMWTYPEKEDVSHLYFKNNMLIRME